jgi:hypothetical protein
MTIYQNILIRTPPAVIKKGPSWSWSYGTWIYNYQCYQCLSPLTWVRTPLNRGVLNTTLCDKVCQWLAAGQWFSTGTLVFSTNKTDRHDIAEILLIVVLNTINKQTMLWLRWPQNSSCCYGNTSLICSTCIKTNL